MSAFVVCREHIDVLVRAAIAGPADADPSAWTAFPIQVRDHHGRDRKIAAIDGLENAELIDPTEVGYQLWAENHASVAHGYREQYDDEVPGSYVYRDPGFTPTCAETARAIASLAYQSCEHPAWDDSIAHGILNALRDALLSALPGVDAAPWAWSASDVAARRGVVR